MSDSLVVCNKHVASQLSLPSDVTTAHLDKFVPGGIVLPNCKAEVALLVVVSVNAQS